jgi:hypothetical protein
MLMAASWPSNLAVEQAGRGDEAHRVDRLVELGHRTTGAHPRAPPAGGRFTL